MDATLEAEDWPSAPTCHAGEMQYPGMGEVRWRDALPERPPYGQVFRTCSYCGSIHPADLLLLMRKHGEQLELEETDWKYGYPHKYYVDGIPNPLAGQLVETGGVYSGGTYTPTIGPAPAMSRGKFYTQHLRDSGYSPAALRELLAGINGRVRETWDVVDGTRVRWRR